ncbi:hypothetical protein FPOAC2_09450 [Fusarium poae]
MVMVKAMTISRIDQQASLACRVFLKITSFVYSRLLPKNDSERPRKFRCGAGFKGSLKDCVNGGYLRESKHPHLSRLLTFFADPERAVLFRIAWQGGCVIPYEGRGSQEYKRYFAEEESLFRGIQSLICEMPKLGFGWCWMYESGQELV